MCKTNVENTQIPRKEQCFIDMEEMYVRDGPSNLWGSVVIVKVCANNNNVPFFKEFTNDLVCGMQNEY